MASHREKPRVSGCRIHSADPAETEEPDATHLSHGHPASGYHHTMVLEVSAMVDCGSTWNLISHLFAREHELPNLGGLPSNLKTIDGSSLQVYGQNLASVMARDTSGDLSIRYAQRLRNYGECTL